MHYYQFNVGDYISATAHLEPMEDLAYRRMLDLYYSSEKALPDDINKIARLIRMRSHCDCITTVLNDFFIFEDEGWHCERADIEIFKFHEKSIKAAKSAKARWEKVKQKQKVKPPSKGNANALKKHNEGNAKHKPITINQEPITNNQILKLFVETSEEVQLSKRLADLILERNPNNRHAKTEIKKNYQAWAKHVDLMIRVDKRTSEQISYLIDWTQKDHFWSSNILSTKKLREKFDQLVLKVREQKGKNQIGQPPKSLYQQLGGK